MLIILALVRLERIRILKMVLRLKILTIMVILVMVMVICLRNTSHRASSSQYASTNNHAYLPTYNDHVRHNNLNYNANAYSRDSIVTIFPHSNNHTYHGNPKYMPRKNPYHISNRNQASRHIHDYVQEYPMPKFIYANSHMPYDVQTQGPLRKRGTKKHN